MSESKKLKISISEKEWKEVGIKQGWIKKANMNDASIVPDKQDKKSKNIYEEFDKEDEGFDVDEALV